MQLSQVSQAMFIVNYQPKMRQIYCSEIISKAFVIVDSKLKVSYSSLPKWVISKQPGDQPLKVLSVGLGKVDKVPCARELLPLPADSNRGPHG